MKVATEPTLHEAAAAHREPFIFHSGEVTEPLHKSLERLYKAEGSMFLLAESGWSGVYPGEAWWLIPKGAGPDWMRKHLTHLIAETDLFPPSDSGNVFFHSGDLGDIIAALPTIRQLGGGKMVIGHQEGVGNREKMKGERFDALRPLLECQPYISGVEYNDDQRDVTHNIALFRHDPVKFQSLAHWQARHFGITNLDTSQWLTLPDKERKFHGRIVMNRTSRYQNFLFPWDQIYLFYRKQCTFVGLPSEHEELERVINEALPFEPTPDLLQLALYIDGCGLFIGNQSLAFWIAVGLGVPLIQETYPYDANSMIARDNAVYTPNPAETNTLMYRMKEIDKKLRRMSQN